MIGLRNSAYSNCNSCGSRKDLFTILIQNPNKQGTEITLCKVCCHSLQSLLNMTKVKGIKMCSIDELEEG